jgi:hypothetical protein
MRDRRKSAFPFPLNPAAELRPFDAEAFKSRSIDYATIEPEEPDAEGAAVS